MYFLGAQITVAFWLENWDAFVDVSAQPQLLSAEVSCCLPCSSIKVEKISSNCWKSFWKLSNRKILSGLIRKKIQKYRLHPLIKLDQIINFGHSYLRVNRRCLHRRCLCTLSPKEFQFCCTNPPPFLSLAAFPQINNGSGIKPNGATSGVMPQRVRLLFE